MQTPVGPDVARAAVALQHSHPAAPLLDVLDLVMRHRCGSVANLGPAVEPGAPAVLRSTCLGVWRCDVLPRFAARYSLTP